MTSIFLFDGSFSLPIFCVKRKNGKKNLSTGSLFSLQNHGTIEFSVLLSLCLSVRRFQMPLEGLSFLKTLVTFGIYATDPLLQDMTKIVCFR